MSQEELFKLVDCVPTPIFILDVGTDGIPVYAHYNTSALRKLGRDLASIVGKTTIEAFGAEYGAAAYEQQRETIRTGKQRKYEFELPFNDDIRIVRTTLTPQYDADGHVVRLIGAAQDVSLEWISQTTQAKLENIGSEVEEFVAMAAHDLRTPMRNVMSLAELLEEGFADQGDGKMELITLLKETSKKSMNLISDVLSYASTLNLAAPSTLYPLDALCDDLMQVLDPQNAHTMHCCPLTLSGEKNVMQIVLQNLIDNALKHGKKAHMTIRCDARMITGSQIEVTIRDDGAGFKNPGNVFLETGEFRVDSGYGLLAIRKLILARGGTISASNDQNTGGSSVRFTLPSNTVNAKEGPALLGRAQNPAEHVPGPAVFAAQR